MAEFSNAAMDQLDFDTQLKTSPLFNDLVGRLFWYESNLAEVKRSLYEVDRKIDSLLNRFTGTHAPEFHDPFAPGYMATMNRSRPPLALTSHQPPSDPVAPDRILTLNGPVGLEESNSLGVFEEGHPRGPDFNLAALPPTLTDLSTLPPRTLPASMVFRNGVWADPPPPVSRTRTTSLPLLTPGYESRDPGGYWGDGGDNDRGDDNFPGSGINDYQPIEWWAGASVQEAEASGSLAIAKPNNTENNNRSESISPAASSSAGGYDRRKNVEGTTLRLARICEALGISSTESEIPILQKTIEYLGGTVPVISDPPCWITRTERAKRKREARRACYEELHRLVGPPVEKLVYLRVLDNVLTRVTTGDGGETSGYEPYRVLRMQA